MVDFKEDDKVKVKFDCSIPNFIVTPEATGTITAVYKNECLVSFELCGLVASGMIKKHILEKVPLKKGEIPEVFGTDHIRGNGDKEKK